MRPTPISFEEAARRYCETRERITALRMSFERCEFEEPGDFDETGRVTYPASDACWQPYHGDGEPLPFGESCPACQRNTPALTEYRRLKRSLGGRLTTMLRAFRREYAAERVLKGEE
jgi:hypothetical protein